VLVCGAYILRGLYLRARIIHSTHVVLSLETQTHRRSRSTSTAQVVSMVMLLSMTRVTKHVGRTGPAWITTPSRTIATHSPPLSCSASTLHPLISDSGTGRIFGGGGVYRRFGRITLKEVGVVKFRGGVVAAAVVVGKVSVEEGVVTKFRGGG